MNSKLQLNNAPNSNQDSNPASENNDDIQLHSGVFRRLLRLFTVIFAVVLFGIIVGMIGLFFLFQGGAIENDTLNRRIEHTITTFLGPQFDVNLGPTSVEFSGSSLITITSRDVIVQKFGERNKIATIKKVLVGVRPMSLISGEPKISTISMDGSIIDTSQLLTGVKSNIPADLDMTLRMLGSKIHELQLRLASSELNKISIANTQLLGLKIGPRSHTGLEISKLELVSSNPGKFTVELGADTKKSQLEIHADYSRNLDRGANFSIKFGGLDAREWLKDMDTEEAFILSDGKLNGRINIVFNPDNSAQQPILNLEIGKSKLRLGRKGHTEINNLALNFRLFPKLNRVILERSLLSAGGFQALLVGGITPVNQELGLAGDLDFTLVVEKAQGAPTQSGEKIHPGSMILEGGFERRRKLLNIDQWNLSVVGGSLVGSASIGFDSETPSLVLNGVSTGIPIAAVKQYWPVFLAVGARKWVFEHVHGGRVTSASITTAIPGGILGRLHKGARLKDEHFELDAKIEETRFDTFGSVPPVRNATGNILFRGMQTSIKLNGGEVYTSQAGPVQVNDGSFVIPDIAQRPLNAVTKFVAKGDISAIAQITDAQPLNVMHRMKMTPSQWRGSATARVKADFPLIKNLKYNDVNWQALLALQNATSNQPVSGRIISDGDVKIDVTPQKAVITGASTIDGIRGEVNLVEPIGKDTRVKRKRVLKTRLSEKDRQKIGLELAPVITGPIDIVLEQPTGRTTADISVNLKRAKIELPWVNWQKGVGIPAKANFTMSNSGKLTKISDLRLSGSSFFVKGDLVFDKSGIRSADISQISLNKGDDLSLRIRRNQGAYAITANGNSFNGQALVNKIFHQDGVVKEQGNVTFTLASKIAKVQGFGKQVANNLVLNYSVNQGWLHALDVRANIGANKKSSIVADTRGNATDFKIRSQDAGNALSFLNIYTHMRNGTMVSTLKRRRGKPFKGDLQVSNFTIVDEPKLKKLVSNRQVDEFDRGGQVKKQFSKIKTNRVRFPSAQAKIEKGQGYLKVDGSLTGTQIGLTFNGTLFNRKKRMNLGGTFMPAFGISRLVSAIPLVGQILSNGKDSGLIGITYKLSGPVNSPKLVLNPLSVVAPGIFRKVFEPVGK